MARSMHDDVTATARTGRLRRPAAGVLAASLVAGMLSTVALVAATPGRGLGVDDRRGRLVEPDARPVAPTRRRPRRPARYRRR